MWLIKATGDPNRVVPLIGTKRPLSTFHFPSCTKCNSRYGETLEANAQAVLAKMLEDAPISASDLNILLDWLDKVRIGLWLASIYLGKNHIRVDQFTSHYVKPKFHIESRIGKRDRMVAIYRAIERKKDLCFTGTDGWFFIKTPSCFALLVNHLVFFNISIEFLLSKQLGLPYPGNRVPQRDGTTGFLIVSGTQKITFPVLPFRIDENCTKIYQPMFGDVAGTAGELYGGDYVRDMCIDFDKGVGAPLIEQSNSVSLYPSEPSTLWRPSVELPAEDIVNNCFQQQLTILKTINEMHDELWGPQGQVMQ
jgi:hypothetical protein